MWKETDNRQTSIKKKKNRVSFHLSSAKYIKLIQTRNMVYHEDNELFWNDRVYLQQQETLYLMDKLSGPN